MLLRTKRSNWFSEAKYNLTDRKHSNGNGANKHIKSQDKKCERRAGKIEIRFELAK